AMHYVFNSPIDKFIFDVSHQIYPHKILTGRKAGFVDPINNSEITGYSNYSESEHDHFVIGHTSTSLSLALGMAKARDLNNDNYNVIAIIGDGSLSGGQAFEGLSNAAVLDSNLIIIVNDNDMSIAPVEGGIYNSLRALRNSNGEAEHNIFKSMGFDYYYCPNGNDIEQMIAVLNKVKDVKKPTVLHIYTEKGKGYLPAETNKEAFHWITPGFLNTDKNNSSTYQDYGTITSDYLVQKTENDKSIVVVSAATPGATALTPKVREKLGKSYIDVGISEQHAVGFISGLAKNGAKPVFEVLSSFIQRSYDQLSQDLALNNSPATILVFWGGISSADATHLHIFDIPLISNIPNIIYLAPTNKEEYLSMLNWSIEQSKYSVAIRVPFTEIISTGVEDLTDYSILNKFKITKEGEKIAIIGVGNFYQLGEKVCSLLKDRCNINSTLINPVYLTGLDTDALDRIKDNHDLVITLEDGCLDGGYGEKISRYYGSSNLKVLNYGAKKEFTDRISLDELYNKYHLTPESIVNDIIETLGF
ncbi:1-deoxy-D-xylulose-5-phosphate synthase, partial [bacterium]|nr:1-deoxy-D-xylulose-5-phosphate synthase [bacterium]